MTVRLLIPWAGQAVNSQYDGSDQAWLTQKGFATYDLTGFQGATIPNYSLKVQLLIPWAGQAKGSIYTGSDAPWLLQVGYAALPSGGTPTPTLGALTLTGTLTQGVATSGVTLSGLTDGSSVSFNIAGLSAGTSGTSRTVTGTPATSGSLNATETLAGATNSPRTSSGIATVAAGGSTAPFTSVPVEGWRVNGASSGQQAFTTSEQGFDGTGSPITTTRNLRVTNVGRLGYPNQATPSNQYSLSQYLYATTTLSNVTNGSTELSPKPNANIITHDQFVIGNTIGGSTVPVEVVALHDSGIACVKYIFTDGTNSPVVVNVTTPVVSPRATDKNAVICYPLPTTNLSSLSDQAVITMQVEVYPKVGDASSVVKTADSAVPGEFSPRYFFKHIARAANPPYVYVNATTGVDATVDVNGVASGITKVSTDPAIAAANPFATRASANNALKAATNLTGGLTSGCIMRLQGTVVDGQFSTGTYQNTNGGALITEGDPSDSTATLSWGATAAPNRRGSVIHWRNLKMLRTAGNFFGDARWENIALDNGGFNIGIMGNSTYAMINGLTVTNGAQGILAAAATGEARLIRGLQCDVDSDLELRVVVGCYLPNGGSLNAVSTRQPNGATAAFNRFMKSGRSWFSLAGASNVDRLAIVQSVFEESAAVTTLTTRVSGDIGLGNVTNFICWNNTFASYSTINRLNWGYVDGSFASGGQSRVHKHWSVHGNIFHSLNMKGEVFVCTNNSDGGGPDPVNGVNALGNLAIRNGVGFTYNMTMFAAADGSTPSPTASFAQEYAGVGAISGTSLTTRLDPLFVNNQSVVNNTTAGAGGGDYHLQAGSPAKGVVPLTAEKLPFALDGVARNAALGAIGAYA